MSQKNRTLKQSFILLVLISSIPFFITANVLTFTILIKARSQLYDRIESTTLTLHDTVEAFLGTTVTTYLMAKAEAGVDIIRVIVNDPYFENIPLEEKKKMAATELLSLKVGKTGYYYAINSDGVMVFHPDNTIIGEKFDDTVPVKQQLMMRNGYLEYEWQNSYETSLRKKALYMFYIPEFDWILAATSYRNEFTDMIDPNNFKSTVSSISLGDSGYSFIFDSSGTIIAHPSFDKSYTEILSDNDYAALVDRLFTLGEGFITYKWKEGNTNRFDERIVYGKYIKNFNWVVGTAMYAREINRPLIIMFVASLHFTLLITILLFVLVSRISHGIERPISLIHSTLDAAINGDLCVRTSPSGPVEIRTLGSNLNKFIQHLDTNTKELRQSLKEKEQLIQEIQHRIRNNLQTISSLLSLQCDSTEDSGTREVLQNTNSRISLMAMVYDQMLLSQSDFNTDSIIVSEILKSYMVSSRVSRAVSKSGIKIEYDFDDVRMKRNTAINLCLIVNELLSYCLNNTEEKNSENLIKLSLKQVNRENVEFTIKDELCSFSETKWNRNISRTEYVLVEILTQQIGGTHYDRSESNAYQITIKTYHPT